MRDSAAARRGLRARPMKATLALAAASVVPANASAASGLMTTRKYCEQVVGLLSYIRRVCGALLSTKDEEIFMGKVQLMLLPGLAEKSCCRKAITSFLHGRPLCMRLPEVHDEQCT